jgi:peptidyl-tRNA hydrolase, PTH1 family
VKVIFGLGNPGRDYEHTRHNVGWWVVDHLADVWHLGGWRRDGDSLVAAGHLGTTAVRLVKPQTYMNLSGQALRPFLRRAAFTASTDLLVIVDDVALPVGRYRLRAQGSAGGHNGLKSIEGTLGSREYARLRVGIESTHPGGRRGDLADYVLSNAGKAERAEIESLFDPIRAAIETWIGQGIEAAMASHNHK